MSNARRAVPSLKFNGKNVTTKLADYLESISYEDVASGGSDVLTIQLQNIDFKWMNGWYPTKGDRVSGAVTFKNWDKDGTDIVCNLGTFTLDEIKFSGGPLVASFGCLSAPADESFKTRERTKTWKKVTVQQIANEIAKRYSLSLSYTAPSIKITSLEQSQKSDSAFLSEVCETYDLSMKIYKSKIVVYDQVQQEKKKAVGTLTRASFVDDSWEFIDTLQGVYTGARVSYKSGKKSSDEISIYSGYKAEDAKGSRVLRINQTCDSKTEAYLKASTEVNKSNRKATTLSGDIWPNPKYCAGVNVTISGMGKANGKYFIDKSTIEVTDSGTKQHLEMHRVQVAISKAPTTTKKKSEASTEKKPDTSSKVGDVVNFHGGMHYISSWPGARGYSARAGKAKITLGPNCAGNGKAHPWCLIHTDSESNVYGWVDEGTFD